MRNLMLGGLMAATFLSPAALSAAEIQNVRIAEPVAADAGVAVVSASAAPDQHSRRGNRGNSSGQRQNARQAQRQTLRQQARVVERRQDRRQDRRRDVRQQVRQNYRQEARRDARQDYRRDVRRDARQDYRRDVRQDYRRQQYNNGNFYYNGRSYNHWNNNWRTDRRYNWRGYRSSNRGLFSSRYYSPYRDYRYNRLSIGVVLGSLFYSSRYQIGNPYQYRLPATYGPYRWVRYYNDAVLVDIRTGRTVDVEYDFFY